MNVRPMLAVIPARGGSKGLPGKNLRLLGGLPLIAHTIECAKRSPDIDRAIVSTDSREIALVAREYGGHVPFLRPADLASDSTPMVSVLHHAIRCVEQLDQRRYESVLLLDPTSPGRTPSDIAICAQQLAADEAADGIVGVSVPEFNPLWHCVVDEGGYMRDLVPGTGSYTRRQDVPTVYRINATLYLWRRDYLLSSDDWRRGRLRMHVVPEHRAVHIDDLEGFERTEALLRSGLLHFPWLGSNCGLSKS